jgi:hypothetical protein
MTKNNENLSRDNVISPTTSLSDLPTPMAEIPPTIINPSFKQNKDNPFSRTIYALLHLFRKQSKPDSDKRGKPPVTMHNTYEDNIHEQNTTGRIKEVDRKHAKTGEHDIYRKQ